MKAHTGVVVSGNWDMARLHSKLGQRWREGSPEWNEWQGRLGQGRCSSWSCGPAYCRRLRWR